jgi:hypothetical protein
LIDGQSAFKDSLYLSIREKNLRQVAWLGPFRDRMQSSDEARN